jgi:hypothetical protein
MKKTLIALAAVAVTSTAMAQATLSGNLAVGFAGDTTSAGVNTSGYGIDTANFKLSTSEDLGGGLKISGSMAFEGAVEDQATNGNGVTLGLSGGFGSLEFASTEGSDFLPVDGFTESSAGNDADRITYTAPSMSGFTGSVTIQDSVDAGVSGAPEMNADARGTSSAITVDLNYTTGPVSVDVTSMDYNGLLNGQKATGIRATYNLGIAKVTYGIMNDNMGTASDRKESALTIAAPVGPFNVTYANARVKVDGATGLTGNSLKATYALSKRTGIAFYTEAYEVAGAVSKTKEQSLLLTHSF